MWTIAAYNRKTEKFAGYRAGSRSFVKPFFLTRKEAQARAEQENKLNDGFYYVPDRA